MAKTGTMYIDSGEAAQFVNSIQEVREKTFVLENLVTGLGQGDNAECRKWENLLHEAGERLSAVEDAVTAWT